MSVTVMKDGLQKISDGGTVGLAALTIHLYQNNFTPTKGDTLAAYTEATFSGYAAQNSGALGGDVWDGVNFVWTQQAATVTFAVGAGGVPNNVYGAYWTSADGKLIAAERFAGAPIVMNTLGFSIGYTPTLTSESKF